MIIILYIGLYAIIGTIMGAVLGALVFSKNKYYSNWKTDSTIISGVFWPLIPVFYIVRYLIYFPFSKLSHYVFNTVSKWSKK